VRCAERFLTHFKRPYRKNGPIIQRIGVINSGITSGPWPQWPRVAPQTRRTAPVNKNQNCWSRYRKNISLSVLKVLYYCKEALNLRRELVGAVLFVFYNKYTISLTQKYGIWEMRALTLKLLGYYAGILSKLKIFSWKYFRSDYSHGAPSKMYSREKKLSPICLEVVFFIFYCLQFSYEFSPGSKSGKTRFALKCLLAGSQKKDKCLCFKLSLAWRQKKEKSHSML